jgi:hypothetical protein
MKTLIVLLIAIWGIAACEQQGPLERVGEEVDEGIEDLRNGGETLGNRIDDAADDIRDGVDDAADELER